MKDMNKEYWWGGYKRIYRGVGGTTILPIKNRRNKPLVHAWTSITQSMIFLFVAYGWYVYRINIKMPRWAAKVLRWYQLFRLAKNKAP